MKLSTRNKITKIDIYKDKSRAGQCKAQKKISAIIPNYNYEDFIIERIDSILFQTYPVSELIILDDCSTDNSPKIIQEKLKEINKTHPHIKTQFIQNAKNTGGCVFKQWQKGMKACSGDYFWIAEADDSADCHFLEEAMKKMAQDEEIKIFFTDSMRINQNNLVKSKTCTDWADMKKSGHWRNDYVENGRKEVEEYLSGQIFIMNVSSVVWKNEPRLLEFFKEAENYKIAGDWYIYSRVMEEGKVAYCAKPLNYYRKHDKGSASTVVSRPLEYDEVISVQERIKRVYNLTKEQQDWQITKRRYMGYTANEKNNGTKGTIAWIVPWFGAGSGGHRTIFQNINYLVEQGYKCDMYVETLNNEPATAIYERLVADYGEFKGDIFSGFEMSRKYDMVIATGWNTAEPAMKANSPRKLYFIQDFEPWFFSMGGDYMKAENTYRLGLKGITIGRWLSQKVSKEFPETSTNFFHFCADLNIYKPLKNIEKENAVCLIFQPGKPRRCDSIALEALQIVQKLRPETKIYLYGSAQREIKNLKVTHLGTMTTEKCNELYNKCSVGVCMSASNPSRIPFEMMAAGLPVVELYRENNLYDLPEQGCLLAQSSPEGVATAILKILDNQKLQASMSKAGHEFMQAYPLEKGFEEFGAFIAKCLEDKSTQTKDLKKTYTAEPVVASKEVREAKQGIKAPATFSNVPSVAELAKLPFTKRGVAKAKRITKKAIKKAINFIRES